MVCPAEHSHSKIPTAVVVVAAAAARSVAIGNDDAGGGGVTCGHVTRTITTGTRDTTTFIDDEDGEVRTNKHGAVTRGAICTTLKRRLYLNTSTHHLY